MLIRLSHATCSVGVTAALALGGCHMVAEEQPDASSQPPGYRLAAGEPEFPESMTRFGMDCYATTRLYVAGKTPSAPAYLLETRQRNFHLSVDLGAMRFCGAHCRRDPPEHVDAADARRIVLDWSPGLTSIVRRSDGYYHHWTDIGPIAIEDGRCRRVDFTEFPSIDPADPGPVAEDQRAFRSGARRFDMICDQVRQSWTRPPSGDLPDLPRADLPTIRFRQSVDLEAMLACPGECRWLEPIHSAGRGTIVFRDDPDEASWLRMGEGRHYQRRVDGNQVELVASVCTEGPFTPFPGVSRRRGLN